MRPIELGPNQIRRFYRGGARIAAFRGHGDDDAPEDWVASTTTVHGEAELGRSRVDGELLADVLAADPEAFFERAHLERFGAEPALLIKLLDAGERLPLHLHPDERFAAEHLGSPYGKTEAWIILEARPDAAVHVGFSRDLGADELDAAVARQDIEGMVAAMNRLPVAAGDFVYVPAGLPHVIEEGIFLLELQEPSDLSLLLEWGLVPEEDAFLGLPRELALQAVTRATVDVAKGFPAEADRFFRAEWVESGATLEPAFSVLVVTEGEGSLETEHPVPLRRGSTVLVPFAAGEARLTGSARAIRCRPPVP